MSEDFNDRNRNKAGNTSEIQGGVKEDDVIPSVVYRGNETPVSSSENNELKRQLAAVMEIANVITSGMELDVILSSISRELRTIMDYDIGCVAIYQKEENCLFIRHIYRRNGDTTGEGRYVPLDESNLVGWVAINKKPIIRGNIPRDKRFDEIMKEDNLKSDMVVPLILKDSLIGTVNVGSYSPHHFDEFDLELVSKFSRLTSMAIENSQLLDGLENLGEKYKKLMDNASDIIALFNSSAQFVECNNALYRQFGYTQEEVIGKELFNFTQPVRREEAKKRFYSILRGEINHVIEIPYLKKNGDVVYLEVDASVIRIKGHPYILIIAHNITDRKVLEEKITIQNRELKSINKKLMELDQLKSEFLGRISHELRTPLSIIMAYTDALTGNKGGEVNEQERSEFLDVIDKQSKKLLQLINNLLDLSKVEISETMLDLAEGDINEVVMIAGKVVEPFAEQNNVEIEYIYDRELPILKFDQVRIKQVIINLLNNAVKFSGPNGYVRVFSARRDNDVVLGVEDSGPGITRDEIPGIFDNFTQVEGGNDRPFDGMGVGLRLVKHYIRLHGGRVWVEDKNGDGAVFMISLPLEPAFKA